MGFWHVAFTADPHSQDVVKISGFEKGLPPELPKIPEWVKLKRRVVVNWTNLR